MPNTTIALELNDQFLLIFGLKKRIAPSATPIYVNDATGTANIYDSAGTLVAGPLTFTYLNAALIMDDGLTVVDNGNYSAPLPATFNPAPGSSYITKIDLVSPTVGTAHWEKKTTVSARR